MMIIENSCVGVDQGDFVAFSDFEENGEMWTGTGPRDRKIRVDFSENYKFPPAVHVSMSMLDMDNASNFRVDVSAENVGTDGFTAVFRTWGDSRVARVRIAWMSIGPVHFDGVWQV